MMGIEPEKTIYDLVMAGVSWIPTLWPATSPSTSPACTSSPLRCGPRMPSWSPRSGSAHLFAVAKESYDVTVVDTPPFFHGPVLSTLDRTDQLLLVGSMDVPAVKNIKLTMQTLDLLHYPKERRHLLLNRAGSKVGLKTADVERALDYKVEFEVPVEREVAVSVNRGVPMVLSIAALRRGQGPCRHRRQARAAAHRRGRDAGGRRKF